MSHVDWAYKKEEHISIIKNFTALLNKYFPDTPAFWTVGNHESVPVNRLSSFCWNIGKMIYRQNRIRENARGMEISLPYPVFSLMRFLSWHSTVHGELKTLAYPGLSLIRFSLIRFCL
jgi:hypothetical protein